MPAAVARFRRANIAAFRCALGVALALAFAPLLLAEEPAAEKTFAAADLEFKEAFADPTTREASLTKLVPQTRDWSSTV